MPFASGQVVPDGWAAHHRPVVRGVMTATGRLLRHSAAVGDWDPDEGTVDDADPTVLYAGPARVQVRPATTRDTEVAAQPAITREYLVQIDPDGDLAVATGDVWVTDTCPDDPALVTRPLRVADVQFGSMRWSRDLTCTDTLAG